ncbi:MAG: hypothetical protein CM15mP22_2530 [Gammaproteobacteria bacterium]|nr:MAG: hypothetical protein CM15mP22_2530 [Gammaproteobacteria bacterium]
METTQIALLNETYIAVLQMNGLFFIGNIILLLDDVQELLMQIFTGQTLLEKFYTP